MKRLINAISELLEARAELLREEAATLGLGTYARAYKEGQADLMENTLRSCTSRAMTMTTRTQPNSG